MKGEPHPKDPPGALTLQGPTENQMAPANRGTAVVHATIVNRLNLF